MKHILFVGSFVLVGLWAVAGSSNQGVEPVRAPAFGGKITLSADAGKELRAAAEDMAATLRQMTGAEYSLATNGTAGITLLTTKSPLVPKAAVTALKNDGKEPFWVRTEGRERLWLVANDELGVIHGIYWYLQQLGCRWFFPTDNWTHIPKRQDIALSLDRVIRPAFIQRTYFGSGGFGPGNPVDPHGEVPANWAKWNRRNLFGAEYNTGGHTWEAFIARHKQEFEQHPEYLALNNGKRGGVKLCVSNPEVIKLYIADVLNGLRKAGGDVPAISIEPSDSSGYCECPECAKLGKPQELMQVYYYANQVAKAVGAEFPKTRVGLYAYGLHAAVPDMDMEPNILVQVIPYGFNYSGLSAEELIKAWGRKVKHLQLYDYWSITDWSLNLPDGNLLCEPGVKKIRYWHQHGVEGVALESTYSSSGAGLELYMFSRLAWDPQTDEKALVDEFFNLNFGVAVPPMRRMMERWAHGFHLDRIELGKTYADLTEARRLAGGNDAVSRRVADYAIYVEYMRRRMEYLNAPESEKSQEIRRFLLYLWRQLPTTMVHPYRFSQKLMWKHPGTDNLIPFKSGQVANRQAEIWSEATPITQAEALGWIDSGAAAYPLLKVERQFSERLVPLGPVKSEQNTIEEYNPELLLVGETVVELEVPQGMQQLTFKLKNTGQLSVTSESGKEIPQQLTPVAGAEWDAVLKFPAPGQYQVKIVYGKTGGFLRVPRGLPLSFRKVSFASISQRMYFYVPKGTQKVYLLGGCAPDYFKIFNPQGTIVKVEINDLTTFEVPQGMDGQVWSLQHLKGSYTGMNVPWLLAFSPDTLMVPEELLPKL